MSASDAAVVHNAQAGRFEIRSAGQTAFSKYLLAADKMIIEHTEVPAALQGKGLAGKIVSAALDHARAQHLKVMPLCPYAAAFIRRHAQYQDLVVEGYRY